MPTDITFQCYGCNQTIRMAAENAGKRVKCRCGTILTVPTGPPSDMTKERPAPAPRADRQPERHAADAFNVPGAGGPRPRDDYDDPRRARDDYDDDRRDPYAEDVGRPANFGIVRIGLLLNFIGALIAAGTMLLQLIGYLFFTLTMGAILGRSEPNSVFRIFLMIAAFIELAGCLLSIGGYVCVMLGPKRRGALGLAIAAIAVAFVHVLLSFIFLVPEFFGNGVLALNEGRRGPPSSAFIFLWLTINLLYVAQLILFLFVLRAVMLNAGRRPGGTGVLVLVSIYGGIRLVGYIFFFIAFQQWMDLFNPMHARTQPPYAMTWIGIVFLWLGALTFVGFVIPFVLRIWGVRSAIARA